MPEQPTPREAELIAQMARATADNVRLGGELTGARMEIKLLREKIDALVKRLFGAQSEKLDAAQLLLMLQGFDESPKAPEPVAPEEPRRSTPASPPRDRGPRWPADLPVVEEVIDPEPVKGCPEAWRQIGEEVTELLDYEPARFFKRRIVRRKFVQREHPFAAPIIGKLHTLQDRCIAAPGLLAAIITGKYCDHLPLYRQQGIFATRHAICLPRQRVAR
jgi:transposase